MRPVELYTFAIGASIWRIHNSIDATISAGGNSFSNGIIDRDKIGNGEGPLDITMPASHSVPQSYINSAPGQNATITVQWLDRDDDPASLRTIYKGILKAVKIVDDGTKAHLHAESIISSFKKETPEDSFSPQCQAFLYDSRCQVNQASFSHEGTVTSVSGNTITVDGLSAKGAGWALAGYIAFGTDYRQVLAQDSNVLTVILPFGIGVTGETVTVYAGCDHSAATCESKFNNLVNHRGFPYVPTKNPFESGLK